jgi:hypothetical protein
MRNKLIAGLVALLFAFGGGFYLGHVQYPPKNVDPQVFFDTVFTPYEDGTTSYINWLDQHVHKSLYVADYTFNNEAVVNKYIELKTQRHVDIHILLDLSESRAVAAEQPLIDKLRAAGIEVVVGTSPHKHAIMHNKWSIADMLWVEDGSWNYTGAADDQANTFNMNNVPSPRRASMFKSTWDKLHDFMKQQQDKRDAKSRSH